MKVLWQHPEKEANVSVCFYSALGGGDSRWFLRNPQKHRVLLLSEFSVLHFLGA